MKKIIIYLLIGGCTLVAHSQVVENMTPQEKKQLTRVTEPITLFKGFLRAGASSQYSPFDKNFDEDGNRRHFEQSVTGHIQILFLNFSYGITDRLELTVNAPITFGQVKATVDYEIPFSGEVGSVQQSTNYAPMGDIFSTLRYQIVKEKPGSPAVVIGLGGIFPTADNGPSNIKDQYNYTVPAGKSEWGTFAELRIRKISYPFSYEFGLAYSHFFGSEKVLRLNGAPVNVTSGPELLIRPQINFHLNSWVSLTHYVDYYRAFKDDFVGVDDFGTHNNEYDQWTIRYYPAINFQIGNVRLEQAVLLPLAGRTFTADPSYFIGIGMIF